VDILFGVVWHIVIDDVADALDVQPARGDVRCHEHVVAALAEPVQRRLALTLRPVSVDRLHLESLLVQRTRHAVRAVLRAQKHQSGAHAITAQQRREQRRLAHLRHRVYVLPHGLDGFRDGSDLDACRVALHVLGQPRDLAREGR